MGEDELIAQLSDPDPARRMSAASRLGSKALSRAAFVALMAACADDGVVEGRADRAHWSGGAYTEDRERVGDVALAALSGLGAESIEMLVAELEHPHGRYAAELLVKLSLEELAALPVDVLERALTTLEDALPRLSGGSAEHALTVRQRMRRALAPDPAPLIDGLLADEYDDRRAACAAALTRFVGQTEVTEALALVLLSDEWIPRTKDAAVAALCASDSVVAPQTLATLLEHIADESLLHVRPRVFELFGRESFADAAPKLAEYVAGTAKPARIGDEHWAKTQHGAARALDKMRPSAITTSWTSPPHHDEPVFAVAGAGDRIISAGRNSVASWAHQQPTTLEASGAFAAVAIGSEIFIGDKDGAITAYGPDGATRSWQAHPSWITVLSRWGDALLSVGKDRVARRWQVREQRCDWERDIARGSSDRLITGLVGVGSDRIGVTHSFLTGIWIYDCDALIREWNAHQDTVWQLCENGQHLFSSSETGTIACWNPDDGSRLWKNTENRDAVMAMAARGDLVVAAGVNRVTMALNAATGAVMTRTETESAVRSLAFVSDRTLLAGTANGRVLRWQLD